MKLQFLLGKFKKFTTIKINLKIKPNINKIIIQIISYMCKINYNY